MARSCLPEGTSSSDEAVVGGEERQLETARHTGFIEDARQVVLDRLVADRKFLRDVLIAEPGNDVRDDYQLARGEAEFLCVTDTTVAA